MLNWWMLMSIKKEFKKYGYTFKQIKREGAISIYKQINQKGEVSAYEVVILRKKREPFSQNRSLQYPQASEWGKYGWTYEKLENAQKKYEQLTKGEKYNEMS